MPERAQIELPNQNVTVLGAFNPEILGPAWVQRHIENIAPTIEMLVPTAGGTVMYRAGELTWVTTRERLVVCGPPRATGQFVAGVLEKLPHTPLVAIGVNSQLAGELSPSHCGPWRLERSDSETQSLLDGTLVDLSFSQAVRRKDGVRLTLKLTWPTSELDVLLDFNYHLDAKSEDSPARAGKLRAHALRADEFCTDAERICEVLLHDSAR